MAQSQDDHQSYDTQGLQFALFMIFMTLYTLIGSTVSYHKLKFLNESGVSILLGMGLSAILYFQFDEQILMSDFHFIYFFVPPIILAEGFNLRKQHLISNIGYSFVYGYIGTMINFLLLYVLINAVNNEHDLMVIDFDPSPGTGIEVNQKTKLNLYEILLMSASLSSKDSFSATQMIDHHSLPILHSLVFGEGIINDAASLALFESIQSHPENYSDQILTAKDIFTLIGFVILNFVISVVFGIFFGIIGSLILKYATYLRKSSMYELMFIFCISLVSYSLVESIFYSGILSLLVTGLILGSFGWYNLTEKAKIASNITFQFFSAFTESIVFFFLGLTSFLNYHNVYNFKLIGLCISFIIIGRIIIVFVLGFLMGIWNQFTKFPIPFKQWIIFFWSGTPRGILSYALMTKLSSPRQYMILSTVQIVVIITTLFFGSTLQFIQWLLLKQDIDKLKAHHSYEEYKKKCLRAKRHVMEGQNNFDQLLYSSKLEYHLTKFNQIYMKPFLIYKYTERQKEIEASKILFKEDRWEIFNPDESNKKQLLQNSEAEINQHSEFQSSLNQQQLQKLEENNIMQTSMNSLRKGSLIDFIMKKQNTIFANNTEKIYIQQAQQYDNFYKYQQDQPNQNIEMLSNQPSFEIQLNQNQFNIQ